jgi:cytochrome c biogenesis protein CcdA
MLRLVGVVISVGLADSLNPSTVGPALYLATGTEASMRVGQFTLGVFGVNLLAGLILTIGPGRLLVALVPNPQGTVRHVIELTAGAIMLALAAGLWLARHRLARHELPGRGQNASSALVLGASLALIDLPTAAPYLATIAAIAASSATVPQEIVLLGLYNAMFVVPLLAIVAVLLVAGRRADPWLQRIGAWLQRRWPVVLSSLLLVVGGALIVLGGTGLVRS